MEKDAELLRVMRRCGHFIHHRRNINQSQSRILTLLNSCGPMNQKELMERMHIQAGSLSEVVSKVEAAGYIQKHRSNEDKRNFELRLTPEGKEQAKLFEKQHSEFTKSLFVSLSEEQKDDLSNILNILLEDWDNDGISNN